MCFFDLLKNVMFPQSFFSCPWHLKWALISNFDKCPIVWDCLRFCKGSCDSPTFDIVISLLWSINTHRWTVSYILLTDELTICLPQYHWGERLSYALALPNTYHLDSQYIPVKPLSEWINGWWAKRRKKKIIKTLGNFKNRKFSTFKEIIF